MSFRYNNYNPNCGSNNYLNDFIIFRNLIMHQNGTLSSEIFGV